MKMTVRMVEPGDPMLGAVPMLCDENGKALPNQTKVTVIAETDKFTKVIVEFTAWPDGDLSVSSEPGHP